MARLLTPARLLLGAILLLNGLNHFFGPLLPQLWPQPVGTNPLAIQLIEALHFSALFDVVMAIQLVTGAALLANLFVPLALAASMPVSVCALYWALLLEQSAGWSLFAGLTVLLSAFLMFALLPAYHAMLQPQALALGEDATNRYENRYARPAGQTSAAQFALALLPLAAAAAFYQLIVPSMLAFYCLIVLLVPLAVLVLRLLQGVLAKPQLD